MEDNFFEKFHRKNKRWTIVVDGLRRFIIFPESFCYKKCKFCVKDERYGEYYCSHSKNGIKGAILRRFANPSEIKPLENFVERNTEDRCIIEKCVLFAEVY